MQHREFSRPIIDTGTVRKMDRDELQVALWAYDVPVTHNQSDDELRELLMLSVELSEARVA